MFVMNNNLFLAEKVVNFEDGKFLAFNTRWCVIHPCVSGYMLSGVTHTTCSDTYTLSYSVALIYQKYIHSRLYRGTQSVLSSSPPSSHPAWIYSTEPFSASAHPLISHHFTQISASASLFLLIAHNNPPKSLSGPAFPSSPDQKHNRSSASGAGEQRRSVSLMNAYTSVGDFLCR